MCERVRWCWRWCARMCVLMPKQRRTATWMSRRTRAVIHYPRSGEWSQASRQRVGDECLRRLISMLPCAMDSSAAPSAALAAATERPSAVSAAIVEWGTVPQTPTAITASGSKAHVCGSRAPGTRRATEAHGFRWSHGSYLACLRPTAAPRLASSATVNSMGMTTHRSWPRQYRSGWSGLLASSSPSSTTEVARLSPSWSPLVSLSGGASVASDRSRTQVARDNRRVAADLRCGRIAVMAWSCRKRR